MAKALELLRDRLMEDSIEISYDNIDGVDTLRLILDSIGADQDGLVVLEVSRVPLDEVEKYGYYHFFSIIANQIEKEQIAGTMENLNAINLETLLGSFGIVAEAGTLTHKYVLRTEDTDAEKTAEDLYNCMIDVVAVVNNSYEAVLNAIVAKKEA